MKEFFPSMFHGCQPRFKPQILPRNLEGIFSLSFEMDPRYSFNLSLRMLLNLRDLHSFDILRERSKGVPNRFEARRESVISCDRI